MNDNYVFAILHLKEASKLLENLEPELSTTFLDVAQGLLIKANLTEDQVKSLEKQAEELES